MFFNEVCFAIASPFPTSGNWGSGGPGICVPGYPLCGGALNVLSFPAAEDADTFCLSTPVAAITVSNVRLSWWAADFDTAAIPFVGCCPIFARAHPPASC